MFNQTVEGPAAELFVISVDPATLEVKIGSKSKDPQSKLYQVSSEDARTLAVKTATERGIGSGSIRNHFLQYGDDKTGTPAKSMIASADNPVFPFLLVKLAGSRTGGSGYIGDSYVEPAPQNHPVPAVSIHDVARPQP